MSQLDGMIQRIIDDKCPLDTIKDEIRLIEINDINITKVQEIENLLKIHEENTRNLRNIIRLKTSKYYRNKLLNLQQTRITP